MRLAPLLQLGTLIALRRTAADWRLQAAVAVGMVLAVALMASGVIYSDALRETALQYTLRNASAEEVNLSVRVSHALERPAFDATTGFVGARVHVPLRPYLRDSVVLIATSTFFFTGLPSLDLPDAERPRGNVQAITALDRHVRLVEGRLPRRAEGVLEVVIDPLGSQALGLSVGRRFALFPAFQEDSERTLAAQVVGIIEPSDPGDEYWRIGYLDRLTNTEGRYVSLPLYAEGGTLFDTLGEFFPGLYTSFTWLFSLDREGLRADQAEPLQRVLRQSLGDLHSNLPNVSTSTKLDQVLRRYSSLLVLARVPLFLMVFLAVGVVLYSLFLTAGLIGRVRAPEVAQLRSRGASLGQVGVMLLVEGFLLAAPAVILGPFLAQALVLVTGRLFPAASGSVGLTAVTLSPAAFLLGVVGGLLAVAVLAGTTFSTARHGVVEFRRVEARPPSVPFLQRYYIDLMLVALVGLVWWQLRSRGSFLVQPLAGQGAEIDLALILGPVLGVLVAGLLLLRLFPLVMRLIASLADPVGPVWLTQGLRRVARDPIPAASLVVLLALAVSLGVVSSALLSTLERSQRDRALYQAGADLRIHHSLGEELVAGRSVARSLASVPGTDAATDVLRERTMALTENFGSPVDLLAVDPDTFAQVAWFRSDFAAAPLEQTLGLLKRADAPPEGIPLPPGAGRLGVWMAPGPLSRSTSLFARLRDVRGTCFDILLGEVSGRGWRHLEAEIRPAETGSRRRQAAPTVAPPYTLHTLWVGSSRQGRSAGAFFLDRLQAITPEGPVEVASFQSLEGWHSLEDPSAPGTHTLEISEGVARPGRRSVAFTWGGEDAFGPRGIRAGPAQMPLPALVSPSFLEAGRVRVGDVVQVSSGTQFVPMELVGVIDYFPTLDPRTTPFVVVDLASLSQYMAIRGARPLGAQAETWIRADEGGAPPGAWSQAIVDRGGVVVEVLEAAGMVDLHTQDPLLTAGWTGLLALSFLTVVLASSSGLLLYAYTEARERQGEFALLRSLGFSRLQMNGVVWFNLALVVSWGVVMGILGGLWLGGALLPLLEVAEEGTRVTPPMVLQINWAALAAAFGALMAAMFASVVALAWSLSHMDLQRLLRMEAA